jgi:hypothetical protein
VTIVVDTWNHDRHGRVVYLMRMSDWWRPIGRIMWAGPIVDETLL